LVVVVTLSLAAPLAAQTKNEVFAFFDDPSASSTGGVAFRVTDHFFIRADGKRLLGGSALTYDPSTRGGLGFSWRF